MKYQQMSLREAFHYLRSRRHIIGPNFGFIKQLIAYERSIFGYTTVSFVNTSFGAVPDIYLATSASASRRPLAATRTIPVQKTTTTTNNTANTLARPRSSSRPILSFSPTRSTFSYSSSPSLAIQPRQTSYVQRTTTSALPTRSPILTNYSNAYNQGATTTNSMNNRPVTSSSSYQTPANANYRSSSYIRQPPEATRMNSTITKPFELPREFSVPTKITNPFRTVTYVPSSYNRYHMP
ncbi:hypothetical protein I4U23_007622 [Adineta vaga]|nr:hypothetical protein I4U23_007622 [Adineta vaga]